MHDKLKTVFVYELVFNSTELVEIIKKLFKEYSDKINNLSEEVHQFGVTDGSIEYFRINNKVISGCNILEPYDILYVKKERPSYIPDQISDEEFYKNEDDLEILNTIYSKIIQAINKLKNN